MGLFVWTCRDGAEFRSEPPGFRLVVGGAASGGGYRYRVFGRGEADMLASGARETLREAIDAAEAAATSIDPSLAAGRITPAQSLEGAESNAA